MLLHFLCASFVNMSVMFAVDTYLSQRVHRNYLRHFVLNATGMLIGIAVLLAVPSLSAALSWQRPSSWWWSPIKIIVGLLLFDGFVYFVHRFLEHSILWQWHRQHHSYVSDRDLTYYTACQIGGLETAYYLSFILLISVLLGTDALETWVLMTWIFQHGAYMHHRGLPELPWPLISGRHHRTHHFNAKRYYGGLFLFWDRPDPIDKRALPHG